MLLDRFLLGAALYILQHELLLIVGHFDQAARNTCVGSPLLLECHLLARVEFVSLRPRDDGSIDEASRVIVCLGLLLFDKVHLGDGRGS